MCWQRSFGDCPGPSLVTPRPVLTVTWRRGQLHPRLMCPAQPPRGLAVSSHRGSLAACLVVVTFVLEASDKQGLTKFSETRSMPDLSFANHPPVTAVTTSRRPLMQVRLHAAQWHLLTLGWCGKWYAPVESLSHRLSCHRDPIHLVVRGSYASVPLSAARCVERQRSHSTVGGPRDLTQFDLVRRELQ